MLVVLAIVFFLLFLGMYIAAITGFVGITRLLPSVEVVEVDTNLSGVDPRDARSRDYTVLSTVCTRAIFKNIHLERVSPIEAVRSFTARMNLDRQFRLSEVIPFSQTEQTIDENTIDLTGISPEGFEILIRDLCERMSMESIVTKASHHGGIDVWH